MQAIAAQNNLSETAFFTRGDLPEIRWFTPTTEIDLCGHATLASAHVLFNELGAAVAEIEFASASGPLRVGPGVVGPVLDFPAIIAEEVAQDDPEFAVVSECVDVPAEAVLRSGGWRVLVAHSAAAVAGLSVDLDRVRQLARGDLVVTARGAGEDDVASRVFGPGLGIDEDPVTGSAHCLLGPYWSARLGRSRLRCRQESARGGRLEVVYEEASGRVLLSGACKTFSRGQIDF